MLKRTIVKAGFFGHGALFLVVTPNSSSMYTQDPVPQIQVTAPLNSSDTLEGEAPDTTALYPAPPPITPHVKAQAYAKVFIKKNQKALESARKRSENYFRIIEGVLTRYNLPLELKYLAVVESQLRSNAISRAGARGPWQLMPATARWMGLKVDARRDERTHVYKSTVAAAKYLKSLYNEYGDWLLVIAAYNSGTGTVQRAIKKAGSRNFWALQPYLPAETRGHVKRFIATHQFFQEQGSLTMLTKKETIAYQQKLESYRDSVVVLASRR
jgi:membrane-bound lytic murein transglycosylase D